MIMIIITIFTMNVEYIWLTPRNAMQIKVASAVAYDFNQLLYDYAVCASSRPVKKNLPRLAHNVHPCPAYISGSSKQVK